MKEKNNKKIERIIESADNGDINSMLYLASAYYLGDKELDQDYKKAYEYYEKAANLDNPIAQTNLGIMYKDGTYVDKDLDKARYYLAKAALNGNEVATYLLRGLDKE